MQPTTPICQGMVLAQGLWRDPSHGGVTLLGMINFARPGRYPYTMPCLVVYFVLGSGRGRVPINVRLLEVLGEEEEVLATHNLEVELADPLVISDSWVIFTKITFPHAGTYRIQVRSQGAVLHERRFMLEEVRKPS